MNLNVFTLALDAMPWMACTYAELMRLTDIPWQWTIVHGAAMNGGSTRWMQRQVPRLSKDGTTEFLFALKPHPRIKVIENANWGSKDVMCEAALKTFTKPGVLLQIDGDELWTAPQLRQIRQLFIDDPHLQLARFHCDYFLGPNIRTTDAGSQNEWLRAWRHESTDQRFLSHEPPNFAGNKGKSLSRIQTQALGLVFQHHAYTLHKHVAMKEKLYGQKYAGLTGGWLKLQQNQNWPLPDIGQFLPQAFKGTPADTIFKS